MNNDTAARLLAARERLAAGGFRNPEDFKAAVAEERAAFEAHTGATVVETEKAEAES